MSHSRPIVRELSKPKVLVAERGFILAGAASAIALLVMKLLGA